MLALAADLEGLKSFLGPMVDWLTSYRPLGVLAALAMVLYLVRASRADDTEARRSGLRGRRRR